MNNVSNLIAQNQWQALGELLKNKNGFIGWSGGRYIGNDYVEVDGYLDLNQICWEIYEASQNSKFNQLSHQQHLNVEYVIKELRRLYDETQTDLSKTSYLAALATRVYDFHEKIYDGYQPVVRLEHVVLPELGIKEPNQMV